LEVANYRSNFKLGDEINTFFIKNQPIRDKYIVAGIFETGLEELDKEIVISDIRNVQRMNDWGIQAAIRVADTITSDGQFVFYADIRGGNGNYRYDWGQGFEPVRGFTWCDVKDTTIRLIVSDFWSFINESDDTTLPDTAYMHVKVHEVQSDLPCYPEFVDGKQFKKEFLNDAGTHFAVTLKGGKRVEFKYDDGKGSFEHYIGGLEVLVNNWGDLDLITRDIRSTIFSTGERNIQDFRVQSIKDE
jgi:lipoprotein-releasing system permease protein